MHGWLIIFGMMALLGLTTAAGSATPHTTAWVVICVVFSVLFAVALLTRAIRRRV